MIRNRLFALLSIVALVTACGCLGAAGCGGGAHDHTRSQPTEDGNAPASAEYACPMHPDVVSKSPGNCPKCGMALVARE
jgi:hypothetical protein